MSISFFSVVHIVVLSGIYLYSHSFRQFYISNVILLYFFEIVNVQGYFIKLGNGEYYFDIIQLYLVFLLSLIMLIRNFSGRTKLVYAALSFLGITLLSTLYQGIFPYDGYIMPAELTMNCSWDTYVEGKSVLYRYTFDFLQNMNLYKRVCMYVVVIYTMKINISNADIYSILKKLISFSSIIVLYGYFEMLMKNVLNRPMEMYKFNEFLFGKTESSYTWENASVMLDGSYRLQGFTSEPSQYVFSLLIFSVVILMAIKYQRLSNILTPRWYYIELILILILMPMTGGMSSIWCIFSLLLSYMIVNKYGDFSFSKAFYFGVFFFVGIGLFFFFIEYLLDNSNSLLIERFFGSLETISFLFSNPNILFVTGMDGSTLARFTSIIVCIGNWFDNPFLGLGFGITKAHSFTVSMLVGNGLLGCITWYYFITTSGRGYKKYDHLLLIIIFFIEFIPIGALGGWYTYTYLLLLAEATALYRSIKLS